ncbi:MAG: NAD-dependent epimerase/dehydratase family protein [Polyangiaceae bacterium]|nr:NAD-dependent epimerase/dehydratase family protein [Polyangiaceae bacterium]
MRVLVTGATGFLGSHIADELSGAGAQVRCLVRKTSDVSHLETLPGVELEHGAVEDPDSVTRAMRGVDAVVHAAGVVKALGPAEFHRVNVEGTRTLVEAARRATPRLRRFVHVSSLAAVGPSDDGRPVAADARRPVTHYGRSKAAAEDVVREAAAEVPTTILRPPWIYGPRDRESLSLFVSVKRGVLPFTGHGKNTFSVIYAPDAARACVRAIHADVPSGSTYFLEDGGVYGHKRMMEEIEQALGTRAWLRAGLPMFLTRIAATVSELGGKLRGKPVMLTRDKLHELTAPHWVCDGRDARVALGWEPSVDWTEGTRRTAAWYRERGWL